MKNKPTVTIGISAYNEEANIGHLLAALQKEVVRTVQVVRIIVISDKSTDGTVSIVKTINNSKIQLIKKRQRCGLHKNQNQITRMTKSDILILLDADVLPHKGFVDAICQPLLRRSGIGIVGAKTVPAAPHNFFERIVADARELKTNIYEKIRQGNNLYLCHGRARAFSKVLYSKISWPSYCPEDSYSYLFCITHGFTFVYHPKAKVTFRAPSTFRDYVIKNSRFIAGKNSLNHFFKEDIVQKHFSIPLMLLVGGILQFMFKKPISTITFSIIFLVVRLLWSWRYTYRPLWEISPSSKKLYE